MKQCSPGAHAMPRPPQWLVSLAMSTQRPSQILRAASRVR
jgi:hypothetical protein